MDIAHKIQRDIILKLIHQPKASFSYLQGELRDSNKFAYHLATLEQKNLVRKNGDGTYSLSAQGRKLSAFIEGDTGGFAKLPTVAHVIIARNKEGKYLVQKRLKEPFYGYWSSVSGKINFGFNVEECAKRDLTEETGLVAQHAKISGLEQIKTYEGDELIHHHIMFIVTLQEISGDLKSHTHKAQNAWMSPQEYNSSEKFPGLPFEEFIQKDQYLYLEMNRYMKDGRFINFEIVKKERFPLPTKSI